MSVQHTEHCSALADQHSRTNGTFACECGALNYALCVCCQACILRTVAPECFDGAQYLMRCSVCLDSYCELCANTSFAMRSRSTGGYYCTPCTRSFASKATKRSDDDHDHDDKACVPQFSRWSASFNVTFHDSDRRRQNHTTVVPTAFDSHEQAAVCALNMLRLKLRDWIDKPLLTEVLDRTRQSIENGQNIGTPCLSHLVYYVDAALGNDAAQSVQCQLVLTPLRDELVSIKPARAASTN
jgi:hypothetical protein